jgi:hypothetical protein
MYIKEIAHKTDIGKIICKAFCDSDLQISVEKVSSNHIYAKRCIDYCMFKMDLSKPISKRQSLKTKCYLRPDPNLKILDKGVEAGEKLFAVGFENNDFIGHIGCFDPEEDSITTYSCDPNNKTSNLETTQKVFLIKKIDFGIELEFTPHMIEDLNNFSF